MGDGVADIGLIGGAAGRLLASRQQPTVPLNDRLWRLSAGGWTLWQANWHRLLADCGEIFQTLVENSVPGWRQPGDQRRRPPKTEDVLSLIKGGREFVILRRPNAADL